MNINLENATGVKISFLMLAVTKNS